MTKQPLFKLFCLLLLTVHSLYANTATIKPQRIVSLNLCTDQILMMLVAPERISSLTLLAKDPAYSYMWQAALTIASNSGLAEEIIPLQPDLVLTTQFSPGHATHILQKFNFPVEVIQLPSDFAGIEKMLREIGELVGETDKAKNIISIMHARIEHANTLVSHIEPKPVAVIYSPNGHTAGKRTFKHQVLTLAGYRNSAAEIGVEHYTNLSIEQLLKQQPDTVVVSETGHNKHSLAHRYTDHPALLAQQKQQGILHIPDNQWLCAGPMSAIALNTIAEHNAGRLP